MVDMNSVYTILATFWTTLIAGIFYSYVVYKKNANNGEEFDPAKAKRTIVISVIMGIVIAVYSTIAKVTAGDAELWLSNSVMGGFIVMVIDQAVSYYMGPGDDAPVVAEKSTKKAGKKGAKKSA